MASPFCCGTGSGAKTFAYVIEYDAPDAISRPSSAEGAYLRSLFQYAQK